jgi:hypothetical protein
MEFFELFLKNSMPGIFLLSFNNIGLFCKGDVVLRV